MFFSSSKTEIFWQNIQSANPLGWSTLLNEIPAYIWYQIWAGCLCKQYWGRKRVFLDVLRIIYPYRVTFPQVCKKYKRKWRMQKKRYFGLVWVFYGNLIKLFRFIWLMILLNAHVQFPFNGQLLMCIVIWAKI